MHEEAILEWVLDLHESEPDFIESVDRKTLQTLINDAEHLAVFFCKYYLLKLLSIRRLIKFVYLPIFKYSLSFK